MHQIAVIPAKYSSTQSRMSHSDGRFDYKSVLKRAFKPKIGMCLLSDPSTNFSLFDLSPPTIFIILIDSHWIENLGVLEKKGIKVLDAIISTKGCRKYEKRNKKVQNSGNSIHDCNSRQRFTIFPP